MKRATLFALPLTLFTLTLPAQTASSSASPDNAGPMSTEIRHSYEAVKKNLLGAAAKMPEADYSFKPTPEIRSFGEVVEHVIMAQTHTCPALTGAEAGAAPQGTTKSDLQKALANSFTLCDKAYDSLADATAAEMIKTPRGQRTKLGALSGNVTHDTEQYAILAVYMRLKGLVPPSSEKPSGR